MKVAKTKMDYGAIKEKLTPRIPRSTKGPTSSEAAVTAANMKELSLYTELPFEKVSAESLHKEGFGDWLRLTKEDIPPTFEDKDRPGYVTFVQGWLSYFEMHNSMFGDEDRTLYFDWGYTNKKFALIIYLKPLMYDMYKNGGGKHSFGRDMTPSPDVTFDPHQPKPPPPPPKS